MKLNKLLASAALALSMPVAAMAHNHSNLEMGHSWIKQPIPGMTMTGGFISITNNGMEDEQLLAVHSDIAKVVELHSMVMVDGVMKMRAADAGWSIAPGETLSLKAGGKHIMFIGLQQMIMEGDKVTLELEFKHAGRVERTFMVHMPATVEAHHANGGETMQHDHHGDHSH